MSATATTDRAPAPAPLSTQGPGLIVGSITVVFERTAAGERETLK